MSRWRACSPTSLADDCRHLRSYAASGHRPPQHPRPPRLLVPACRHLDRLPAERGRRRPGALDGPATYLLTKPVPRWQILAAKLAVAWLATATFALASTLVSGLVALEGGGSSI